MSQSASPYAEYATATANKMIAFNQAALADPDHEVGMA